MIAPSSCDQPDPVTAREPCRLISRPDGKAITESNRVLAYLQNIRRYARQPESQRPSAEARRTEIYVALGPWLREIRGHIASVVIIAMAFAQVRRTLEPGSVPDSMIRCA